MGLPESEQEVAEALQEAYRLQQEVNGQREHLRAVAQEHERLCGHEPTCHTVQSPGDGHMGCNCVVADIERGSMGDVVHRLRMVTDERDVLKVRIDIIDAPADTPQALLAKIRTGAHARDRLFQQAADAIELLMEEIAHLKNGT